MAKKQSNVVSGLAMYACVQSPTTKFQKDGSKDPLDFEYKVTVIVDPQQHKEFAKRFKKQKVDPLTPEEFKQKYKVDVPEGVKTNEDGEICIINLKTNNAYTDYKDGKTKLMPKPKVLFPEQRDGKTVLVEDTDTLVGNLSKITVLFKEYENKKWGTVSAKLSAVRVDSLVSYGADDDLSELGEIDSSSFKDSGSEPDFGDDEDADDAPFDADDDGDDSDDY